MTRDRTACCKTPLAEALDEGRRLYHPLRIARMRSDERIPGRLVLVVDADRDVIVCDLCREEWWDEHGADWLVEAARESLGLLFEHVDLGEIEDALGRFGRWTGRQPLPF
nr:MAG: hypothetical protein DIU58_17535 [Sphaerobacter thermophilus]